MSIHKPFPVTFGMDYITRKHGFKILKQYFRIFIRKDKIKFGLSKILENAKCNWCRCVTGVGVVNNTLEKAVKVPINIM
jgi:hypothetical protein